MKDKVLLIDNYDSFVYNLYQYLGELGALVSVKRNDELTLEDIDKMKPSKIVISPGPGRPENAGISVSVVKEFYKKVPILGVCLGHQAVGDAFGANIIKAKNIMHGKISYIYHNQKGLFKGIPNPFTATRYHSLLIGKKSIPSILEVTAQTDQDEIMGIKVKGFKCYGIQFHPESILTKEGKSLLANFLNLR